MKGIDLHKHLPTYVLFYLSFQSLTFLKDEILKQVKALPTKVCQSEPIWKPAPPLSEWRPHWNAYLHLYGVFTIVSLFGTKRSHIEGTFIYRFSLNRPLEEVKCRGLLTFTQCSLPCFNLGWQQCSDLQRGSPGGSVGPGLPHSEQASGN